MELTTKVTDSPGCARSPLTHDTDTNVYSVWTSTLSSIPSSSTMAHAIGIPFGVSVVPSSFCNLPKIKMSNKIIRCTSCRSYLSPRHQWKPFPCPQGTWSCVFCQHENNLVAQGLVENALRWSSGDDPELVYSSVLYEASPSYKPKRDVPMIVSFVFFVNPVDSEIPFIDIYITSLKNVLENISTSLNICIYICTGTHVLAVRTNKNSEAPSIYTNLYISGDKLFPNPHFNFLSNEEALFILNDGRLSEIIKEERLHMNPRPVDTWMFLEYMVQGDVSGLFIFLYHSSISVMNTLFDDGRCQATMNKFRNLNVSLSILCIDTAISEKLNKNSIFINQLAKSINVFPYYEATVENIGSQLENCLGVQEDKSHLCWFGSLRIRISPEWLVSDWLSAPYIRQTGTDSDNNLIYIPVWNRGDPLHIVISPKARSIMVDECHIQCCFLYTDNLGQRLIEVHNTCFPVTRHRDDAQKGIRSLEATHNILLEAIASLFSVKFLDSIRDGDEELLEQIRVRLESFLTLKLRFKPGEFTAKQTITSQISTEFGSFLVNVINSTAFKALQRNGPSFRSAFGKLSYWRNLLNIAAPELHNIVLNIRLWDLSYENTIPQELPLSRCYIQQGHIYALNTSTEVILYICGKICEDRLKNLLNISSDKLSDTYNCQYLGADPTYMKTILPIKNKPIMVATSGGFMEQYFLDQLCEY